MDVHRRASIANQERMRPRALAVLGLAFAACSCTPAVAPSARIAAASAVGGADPVAADLRSRYPDAAAILLDEVRDIDLDVVNSGSTITYRQSKLVLRDLDEHDQVTLWLDPEERLLDIRARTITGTGDTVAVAKSDIHETVGESFGEVFYADLRKVRFTFPRVQAGCRLEYEYRKWTEDALVAGRWIIQQSIPKVRSEFRLAIPTEVLRAGWKWHYQIRSAPYLGEPEMLERGIAESYELRRKTVLRWVARDVAAVADEPYSAPRSQFAAEVSFAPTEWDDWSDPAGWYRKRYLDGVEGSRENDVAALARELTAGSREPEERARKLYDYARGLRYVAVVLGDGGLRPAPARTTADRGWGDCKDKAVLLTALLEAAGFRACPAVVRTCLDGHVDPGFVGWAFDHMIVRAVVGGRAVWLDPTAEHGAFGELPWPVQGVDALVLDPDRGGMLQRTPMAPASENSITGLVQVDVQADGGARIQGRLVFQGQAALEARDALADASTADLESYCRSILRTSLSPDGLTCRSEGARDPSQPLRLFFSCEAPGLIRRQGWLAFVPADVVEARRWLPRLDAERRANPARFAYPKRVDITTRFANEGMPWTLQSKPQDFRVESGALYFRAMSAEEDAGFVQRVELELRETDVAAEDWPVERSTYQHIVRRAEEEFVLTEADR